MNKGPSQHMLKSLSNLKQLLEEIVEKPAGFVGDATLIAALDSQGKLSAYSNVSREILAASLNAYKRTAEAKEAQLPRGYVEVDELRVAARDAIARQSETVSPPKPRTIKALTADKEELEQQLDKAKEDCLHLTVAFEDAIREARIIVKRVNDADITESWRKAEKTLFAKLSMAAKYAKEKNS